MDVTFGTNNMKFHLFITVYEWQYNVSLAWVLFAKWKIWFHGSTFYMCKHKHFMQCLNENQVISLLMIFSITTHFQIRMTCNSSHYNFFGSTSSIHLMNVSCVGGCGKWRIFQFSYVFQMFLKNLKKWNSKFHVEMLCTKMFNYLSLKVYHVCPTWSWRMFKHFFFFIAKQSLLKKGWLMHCFLFHHLKILSHTFDFIMDIILATQI
jgi:hypothetical protein